ncbi:hypothetical protein [Candidatus Tisiphia endosymbiont of Nemotelus uliginosus]|uniref:hypothetical protein n=1 Tax=Candidatus Tisiphia endosymbiont of Nemotelus uliginosus TaxID=3077926 RepID=UPI0035C9360E
MTNPIEKIFKKELSDYKNKYYENSSNDYIKNMLDIFDQLEAVSKKGNKKILRIAFVKEYMVFSKKEQEEIKQNETNLIKEQEEIKQKAENRIKDLYNLNNRAKAFNDYFCSNAYEIEFSQDKANARFSNTEEKGKSFEHKGRKIQEVGEIKPFPTEDFRIQVFNYPTESKVDDKNIKPTKGDKNRTLVVDNNRGTAAHAIAQVPLTRLNLTDSPKNKGAFYKREGDGSIITFDKNVTDITKCKAIITAKTSIWARIPSSSIASLEEIKQKFEASNKEKEKTNDSDSTSKPNTQPKVTRSIIK